MRPEKQILVIAEACGWTDHFPKGGGGILLPYKWGNTHTDEKSVDLPDYLNDLNAMHEAEKVLNEKQEHIMNDTLWDLMSGRKYLWHATAAQRAEAFLKTIGKWEEDK